MRQILLSRHWGIWLAAVLILGSTPPGAAQSFRLGTGSSKPGITAKSSEKRPDERAVQVLSDPDNPDDDNDGLTDVAEKSVHRTDPNVADTDGDGTKDGDEIEYKTDPLKPESKIDTDRDRLPDPWEQKIVDFKSDDYPDSIEYIASDSDFDRDGVSNEEEYLAGTNPTDPGSVPPRIYFTLREHTVSEGATDTEAVFEVRLDKPSGKRIIADVYVAGSRATGDGVDYKFEEQRLVFDAGETAKTVRVVIVADQDNHILEPDENIVFCTRSMAGNSVRGKPECHILYIKDYFDDADGDGIADWWEKKHGLKPGNKSDAAEDPDGDGWTNLTEFRCGGDPHVAQERVAPDKLGLKIFTPSR